MKVACEQVVRAGAATAMVIRPGLIVGPGDPTGRFSYWPARMGDVPERPEVLAPGDPGDSSGDRRTRPRRLDRRQRGVAPYRRLRRHRCRPADPRPAHRGGRRGRRGARAHLGAAGVPGRAGGRAVGGARSVPLWLPRPEYDGMLAHDPVVRRRAGHPAARRHRPRHLAWLRDTPDATLTGLGRRRRPRSWPPGPRRAGPLAQVCRLTEPPPWTNSETGLRVRGRRSPRARFASPVRRQLPPDRDARRHPPCPGTPHSAASRRGRSPRTGPPPQRAACTPSWATAWPRSYIA